MTETEVFIAGTKTDIVLDITTKRSHTTIVSSASFSTPLKLLAEAQDRETVLIKRGNRPLFLGNIQVPSFKCQNGVSSLSLQCVDAAYNLATSERISFAAGTKARTAILELLDGTGLDTSGIGLASVDLPDDCFVFPVGSNRLEAVKKIADGCSAVFCITYGMSIAKAYCDSWTIISALPEFTTTVSVSDSTHLVIAFNLDFVPDNPTEDRATIIIAGTPANMYNILNLSGLYQDLGISYPVTLWRITELSQKIQASGVWTTAILVNSLSDLSDSDVAQACTTCDTTQMIKVAAESAVKKSLSRKATATETGTGTVTVAYSTGESETIDT